MPSLADFNAQLASSASEATVQVTAGAVAPAAGGVVASVNAPKTGLYQITVLAGYGATADVVDNMDLAVNGVQVMVLPVLAAANGLRPIMSLKVRANAGQAVAVRAVAAGGVGSVFRATIIATRLLD